MSYVAELHDNTSKNGGTGNINVSMNGFYKKSNNHGVNHALAAKDRRKNGPLISTSGTNGGPGGMGEQRYDVRFKVLILGNSGVGKTSILRSLAGEAFYQTTISTIGIDLIKKIFTVEGHRVQLEIWDTAGQEQYFSIVSFHFREAKAFIVVYDVTDAKSFDQIRKYWLCSVDKYMDDPVPVFFVANKIDLKQGREITLEQGQQLASQQSAHGFFETSAKTGKNIENLFQKVAESMISTWGAPKRWYEMDPVGATANSRCTQDQHDVKIHLGDYNKKAQKQTCCRMY